MTKSALLFIMFTMVQKDIYLEKNLNTYSKTPRQKVGKYRIVPPPPLYQNNTVYKLTENIDIFLFNNKRIRRFFYFVLCVFLYIYLFKNKSTFLFFNFLKRFNPLSFYGAIGAASFEYIGAYKYRKKPAGINARRKK
ncbi:hypothetical protein DYQ05_05035 [Treponema pedis]|uniref:Uncharacterized protein n=1 Tax=Treponema pedis str. T A4 TaxID=1291379 RepID=S6A3G9_9SPIR|nr:hypothetical protein TPE_1055 [Treponema pedis str. T A4]QSI04344.1 hypothetical protein DYQ05_05035 [Treponema pedis]